MRQLLVFVAVGALILGIGSWLIRWPSVEISGLDIKNANVIRIAAWDDPTSLHIRISGTLVGQATVTDPWGSTTTIGPGDFDETVSGDYYDKEATIQYSPVTASAGTVVVRYNFDHL
jgi:hypothetical protein